MTQGADHLGELARRLRSELRLVGALRDALARQREGIAGRDGDAMLTTAREVGGIVHELVTARRRRVRLVGAITGDEGCPLARLEERLEGPLPEEFLRARAALRAAGDGAAADVRMSRAVVRCALEAIVDPIAGFSGPAGPSVG
jgi:hypothetical protein